MPSRYYHYVWQRSVWNSRAQHVKLATSIHHGALTGTILSNHLSVISLPVLIPLRDNNLHVTVYHIHQLSVQNYQAKNNKTGKFASAQCIDVNKVILNVSLMW